MKKGNLGWFLVAGIHLVGCGSRGETFGGVDWYPAVLVQANEGDTPQSARVTLSVDAFANFCSDGIDGNKCMGRDIADLEIKARADGVSPISFPAHTLDANTIGYTQEYEFSAETASLAFSDVRKIRVPSFFQVSAEQTPQHEDALRLEWTPNHEPEVGFTVTVSMTSPPPGYSPYFTVAQPDNGSFEVPASAFPSAGEYQIEVRRVMGSTGYGQAGVSILLARSVR